MREYVAWCEKICLLGLFSDVDLFYCTESVPSIPPASLLQAYAFGVGYGRLDENLFWAPQICQS